MILVTTLCLAAPAGFFARAVRLPGGILVGSMLVTAAWSLTLGEIAVPPAARTGAVLTAGLVIGMLVTRGMLRELRPIVVPALASSILLVAGGVAVTLLMRATNTAPAGDLLATSPGAMSVLVAAAADYDVNLPVIAMFHLMRIVLILLTLPLLIRLLPQDHRAPKHDVPRSGQGRATVRLRMTARVNTIRDFGSKMPVLGVLITAGVLTGLALAELGVSGGLIFGAAVGAGAVTLITGSHDHPVAPIGTAVQIVLGWIIGAMVTQEVLVELGIYLVPAILASIFVIVWAAGIALALRKLNIAPPGDVLATSPGALEVLTLIAIERRIGVVPVALFHSVRMIVVILSLPVLLMFMPELPSP